MSEIKTLYDTLNARNLLPEQVAETFISNIDFYEIAKNEDTIVTGPRGCGKTTMLKMLAASALNVWKPASKEDEIIKNGLSFCSIYIPADFLWKHQLEKLESQLSLTPAYSEAVIKVFVTTNILHAYVRSIIDLIKTRYSSLDALEFEFSEVLTREWKLPRGVKRLNAVLEMLQSRIDEVRIKSNIAIDNKWNEAQCLAGMQEYYYLNFTHSIDIACSAFERIYNNNSAVKWALCFDELELVPRQLVEDLITQLRNHSQKFIFKLSIGPVINFKADQFQQLPLEGHDFRIVRMWPSDTVKDSMYRDFTKKIMFKRLTNFIASRDLKIEQRITDNLVNLFFGRLDYLYALKEFKFDVNPEAKNDDDFGSLRWWVFKEYARLDRTFSKLLTDKGIDPENPIPTRKGHSSEIFKKLREIVINRLVFSKFDGKEDDILLEVQPSNQSRLRTRKLFPIYYGISTIVNIGEGNPRWIIGIIDDFLNQFVLQQNSKLPIQAGMQVRIVKNISDRFYNLIKSFPTKTQYESKSLHLAELVQKIGEYFSEEINGRSLKQNPDTCFKVDAQLEEEIKITLKTGIEIGAFILLNPKNDFLSASINNEKLRLSYLLAPQFKLPLRQYQEINLSTILNSKSERRKKSSNEKHNTGSLFNENKWN